MGPLPSSTVEIMPSPNASARDAHVVVVGAGPAGVAAARRLRGEPGVAVTLVAPHGASSLLAGVLPVVTGDAAIGDYRAQVRLEGVAVVADTVAGVEPGEVRLASGRTLAADAVVAAPGLALAPGGIGGAASWHSPAAHTVGVWDLDGAAAATSAVTAVGRGVVTVAIAAPLYRCPPAPYGLACRLAGRARRLGLDIRVRVTTPEAAPLEAVGPDVTALLLETCAAAGVEVVCAVRPDLDAARAGELTDPSGALADAALAVVVPPHTTSDVLTALGLPGPTVPVDAVGRSGVERLYVAGDAAAGPYPRAAAPAVRSGIAAAEGALDDLGLAESSEAAPPEPDCFVDAGGGRYRRIQLSYPGGPPPEGRPVADLHPPRDAAASGFDAAVAAWRRSIGS